MARLRPSKQSIITSTALSVLVAATTLLIGLLISSATRLSEVTTATAIRGPLNLFELKKMPLADGGFQATISLMPGAVWYFAAAAILIAGIAALRLRTIAQS